jgi:hypothetical protein
MSAFASRSIPATSSTANQPGSTRFVAVYNSSLDLSLLVTFMFQIITLFASLSLMWLSGDYSVAHRDWGSSFAIAATVADTPIRITDSSSTVGIRCKVSTRVCSFHGPLTTRLALRLYLEPLSMYQRETMFSRITDCTSPTNEPRRKGSQSRN